MPDIFVFEPHEKWSEIQKRIAAQVARYYADVFEYIASRSVPAGYGFSQMGEKPFFFVCRKPNTLPSGVSKGKAIIIARDMGVLEGFRDTAKEIYEADIEPVRQYLSPGYSISMDYDFQFFNIDGVECPDILFSMTPAMNVRKVSGRQVYSVLQTFVEGSHEKNPACDDTRELLARISRDGIIDRDDVTLDRYLLDRRSGMRYNASYYDGAAGRRVTRPVKDLICLCGDFSSFLIKSNTQKERKDKIQDEDCLYAGKLFRVRNGPNA